MPQAPSMLRDLWRSDDNAIRFLQKADYRFTRDGRVLKPTPEHKPTLMENSAMDYLFMEWDYAGFFEE